jgi:hypothetical protein
MSSMMDIAKTRLETIQKPIFSFIFICIVIYVVYMIYTKYLKKKIMGNKYLLFSNKNTRSPLLIPNNEIKTNKDKDENVNNTIGRLQNPLDEYSFTLILKMNIEEYYTNMGYWKHILHKGTKSSDLYESTKYNENEWELIKKEYNYMCPGLWLHPSENKMRVVFDVFQLEDVQPEEHALQISSVTELTPIERKTQGFPLIKQEIIDVPDIPLKKDTTIIIEVDRTSVSVSIDGKYKIFHTLSGLIKINNGPMEVHKKPTYNGKIIECTLIPKIVSKKELKNFL